MLVVACEDAGVPPDQTVATEDLVVLPLVPTAPAPPQITFWVSNLRPTVQTIRHADAFNTPYVELRFPTASLSSLNGNLLTINDSVLVTVVPLPDGYGFTLSPAGLEFTLGGTPSATLFYGRYGDASVADTVAAFPDRQSYLAALEIWQEAGVGRWQVARGSSVSGVDAVGAAVDAPGEFLLAAAR